MEVKVRFKKVSLFDNTNKKESFRSEEDDSFLFPDEQKKIVIEEIIEPIQLVQEETLETEKIIRNTRKNISKNTESLKEKNNIYENNYFFIKNIVLMLIGTGVLLAIALLIDSSFNAKNKDFIPDETLYFLQEKNVNGYQDALSLKSQFYMNHVDVQKIKDKQDFIDFSKYFVSNVFSINAVTQRCVNKNKIQRKIDIIEDKISLIKEQGKINVYIPYKIDINEKDTFSNKDITETVKMVAKVVYLVVKKDDKINIYIDSVENEVSKD